MRDEATQYEKVLTSFKLPIKQKSVSACSGLGIKNADKRKLTTWFGVNVNEYGRVHIVVVEGTYLHINTIDAWKNRGLVVVRSINERAQKFVRAVNQFGCWNNNIVKDEVCVVANGPTLFNMCKQTNNSGPLR